MKGGGGRLIFRKIGKEDRNDRWKRMIWRIDKKLLGYEGGWWKKMKDYRFIWELQWEVWIFGFNRVFLQKVIVRVNWLITNLLSRKINNENIIKMTLEES